MSTKLYDVEGVDHPLRLSAEHAEAIGATPHVAPVESTVPKPGSKDALVAEATALGLSTEGTKAELEARIAEAKA